MWGHMTRNGTGASGNDLVTSGAISSFLEFKDKSLLKSNDGAKGLE